jgi:plastocyanin
MSLLLRMLRIAILNAVVGLSLPQTSTGQELVTVDASGFQPNQMTIAVGDSVLWFNIDSESTHTTTSDKPAGDPDYWNVSLDYTQFYTRTFVRAGTFGYHDSTTGHTGTIIVTGPTAMQLTDPQILNGQFVFTATGLSVGQTNVLQSSTNLTSWVARQTNVAASSSLNFTNPVSGARNFFRLVEWH